MDNVKKLGIYIHIPFCMKKCLYCDFLSNTADKSVINKYLDALKKEIEYTALNDIDFESQYSVDTIFLGGGTPSILEGEQIEEILETIKKRFVLSDAVEITIECNPGTASGQKIEKWKEAGINRISIGLQSADDDELKLLGRIHNFNQFKETYSWAKEAGFENINIDIMSAIPGQTKESYRHTLEEVISFRPQHISSYSLIVEPDTPYYEIFNEDGTVYENSEIPVPNNADKWPQLPDEDTEREMYYMTQEVLKEAGYHRYEISNYSLDGYECRHNSSYWIGTEYIGMGLGASSYLSGVRYSNTSDIYTYFKACDKLDKVPSSDYYSQLYMDDTEEENEACFEDEDIETCSKAVENKASIREYLSSEGYHEAIQPLSLNERMEEFMFLGLRMMRGISKEDFEKRFGRDIYSVYGKKLEKLQNEELIETDGKNIRLTSRGIDISNVVLANFLL